MKKHLLPFTLFFFLLACSSTSHQIIPTKEELEAKKSLLSKEQLREIERELEELSSFSLKEIKKLINENYKNSRQGYDQQLEFMESLVGEYKQSYMPEESVEGFPVNLNYMETDSTHIAFLKKGLEFGQSFTKDTNRVYLLLEPDNNGANVFLIGQNKNFTPYPGLHHTSKHEAYLKKVYYMNGEVEENLYPEDLCFYGLQCYIGKKLPIDSMTVQYSISTICKYDSITILPGDLGQTINGLKVKAFEDNYFSFESENNNIIEVVAYDSDITILSRDFGYINEYYINSKEKFANAYKGLEVLNQSIKKASTKEDALSILENSLLADYLDDSTTTYLGQHFFEGNIQKILIYRDLGRCTQEFDITFVNGMKQQNIFTNTFPDKTEIIDTEGKTVFSIPVGDLKFSSTKSDFTDPGLENTNYLCNSEETYHFNYDTKKLIKQENFTSVFRLSAHLVKAWDKSNGGWTILDNLANKITDTIYKSINLNGNVIVAETNHLNYFAKEYILMDSLGNKLLPEPIQKIAPHYNRLYKVTYNDYEGFINSEGEWVLEPNFIPLNIKFNRKDPDLRGELQIVYNGRYGLVDLHHQAILSVPCEYDYLETVENTNGSLYIAMKNDQFGIITINNETLQPIMYSYDEIIQYLDTNTFSVR